MYLFLENRHILLLFFFHHFPVQRQADFHLGSGAQITVNPKPIFLTAEHLDPSIDVFDTDTGFFVCLARSENIACNII